jgi:hypothetical protein
MEQNNAKPLLSLTSLPVADFARLLSRVGDHAVTVAMIESDLAAGAPLNADGSINLVNYAAWLAKESDCGD